MSFVQSLRAATASDHETVDAAFGRYALGGATGYRDFLLAHARALPAVERVLTTSVPDGLPSWRPRTEALADDLTRLGTILPVPLAYSAAGEAERWGALYVIEGSRLGGQVLARTVPAGLPTAYLAARHLPGEWRAFLAALDARAAEQGDDWRSDALAGARATFALYARAAAV